MIQSVMQEQRETKRLVEECMAEDPRCRNSDMWLLLAIWQKKQHIKLFIPYDGLQDMIPAETITRVRREIQNGECKWLPTDPQVICRRKMKEEVVRQYYAGNNSVLGEYERIRYGVE